MASNSAMAGPVVRLQRAEDLVMAEVLGDALTGRGWRARTAGLLKGYLAREVSDHVRPKYPRLQRAKKGVVDEPIES